MESPVCAPDAYLCLLPLLVRGSPDTCQALLALLCWIGKGLDPVRGPQSRST